MKAPESIPALVPPFDYSHYIEWFFAVRGFCGVIDNVMTPSILKDWSEHECVTLERWERDLMFAMDRSFRQSHNKVVSWHMKRKQINVESDSDKSRVGKRKN